MELQEKYQQYKDFFFDNFIDLNSNGRQAATHIPASDVTLGQESKIVDFGDGTINIAEYLQYLFTLTKVVENVKGQSAWELIVSSIITLQRLSKRAYSDAHSKFPGMEFDWEQGFFLRDDVSRSTFDQFKATSVHSGYASSIELGEDEDPCYSPFVSQDQIWNLAPILAFKFNYLAIDNMKEQFLASILKYVIDHGHTIYNPYYSTMKHYWTYCPTFNTEKVKPWDRKKDRKDHLKFDIKVKRGANNWYFAYGFRKTYNQIGIDRISSWGSFLYSLIYYPLIFVADRIWYPLLHGIFGKQKKDNSYYCLATAGKVWYSGRKGYLKRVCKLFNKDTDHWNVAFLECMNQNNFKYIDFDILRKWLEEYPELKSEGKITSPIKFMTLYNYYKLFA